MLWGIEIWGAQRHATQIYDTLAAFIILVIFWPTKINFSKMAAGAYFIQFVIFTSAARLFLEGFRGDSSTLANGIRLEQILAWLALATALWGLTQLKQNIKKKGK
jgi:prolipoprotein diacylglyceryltransferase